MNQKKVIKQIQQWVETMVVGLKLCPFARHEMQRDRVRFSVTDAVGEEQLLTALQVELELLSNDETIETTLLIHPDVLTEFYDYNQFLDSADSLLVKMSLEGVYQIASFHPDYQYHGTQPGDEENYINRSPYPVLHILRENSVERAIASHPDTRTIPEENIALVKKIGKQKLQALLDSCHQGID